MSSRTLLTNILSKRQIRMTTFQFAQLQPSRKFTMSSTFFSNHEPEQPTNTSASTTPKKPLALPEVPHNGTTQLDMSNGSTSVKLDHLGPMVVNVDGTLARISNWEQMTDSEKQGTLRIIGKRNKQRLEALKAKGEDAK